MRSGNIEMLWSGVIAGVSAPEIVRAELLALVGILGGTPGKGAIAWYTNEGGRGLFKSLGRAAESARLQIRKRVFKRYDMEPLVQKYVATVRKDKILWAGSAIGSVASVLLGGEVTPQ